MSELSSLLTIVIPIALVASISPTTFAVMIVLLSLSKKPKTSGLGFLVGSLIIILLAALLGIFVAESASLIDYADISILPAWMNVILGVILFSFGVKTSFKKEYNADEETENLKDKYQSYGFWGSVLLAMGIFTLNLITTILVFFASSQIGLSNVNLIGKTISLIILISITLLLVEIPLLICFLVPQKADNILSKLNGWIQKNGHYLTAGLTIIIGIYLISKGLGELNLI
ncbi:GAP family protein [Methanobacterium oryzae]|uniref:GAP family protein n=1 Tax=Methanobacterium oryzae TaxID=69540 RepID=UPI003D1F7A51